MSDEIKNLSSNKELTSFHFLHLLLQGIRPPLPHTHLPRICQIHHSRNPHQKYLVLLGERCNNKEYSEIKEFCRICIGKSDKVVVKSTGHSQ